MDSKNANLFKQLFKKEGGRKELQIKTCVYIHVEAGGKAIHS